MIKHLVIWKLKSFAKGQSKSENLIEMKNQLEELKKFIPQICILEVGLNTNQQVGSYDISLMVCFEKKEDMKVYIDHPKQKKVSSFIRDLRDSRVIIDYEV